MIINYEAGELISDFLAATGRAAWSDEYRDDFLAWVYADKQRSVRWNAAATVLHVDTDDEMIARGVEDAYEPIGILVPAPPNFLEQLARLADRPRCEHGLNGACRVCGPGPHDAHRSDVTTEDGSATVYATDMQTLGVTTRTVPDDQPGGLVEVLISDDVHRDDAIALVARVLDELRQTRGLISPRS